jgi:beta-galactosidase
MRHITNINSDWQFIARDEPQAQFTAYGGPHQMVCLPHSNATLPHNHFSESEYCFVSWYRRRLFVPLEARDGCVFIDFDGVMIAAQVFLNGQWVGEHKGGFTPFSVEVTALVRFGQDNWLSVRVDSTERSDIPPFGGLVDYLTFGGIYRDVFLRVTEPVFVQDIATRAFNVLQASKGLEVIVNAKNSINSAGELGASVTLYDPSDQVMAQAHTLFAFGPEREHAFHVRFEDVPGLDLWELEHPTLYRLEVRLENGDSLETSLGFRSAEFREDGAFYLNGNALKLRGLNRHQSYPYIGMAAPARLQALDAQILKFDLGCNIVRTSHYPQSPHFLQACDQIGLLVLEEIPGWQHIGDAAWKELSLEELRAMIVRDRNHPSIIMWGVRINESADDHGFYACTNALAQQLDPTRPTGGIRCFHGSELLEDVYTMNDFKFDLGPPDARKYLVTEYGGHMYPTKSFDQEERVLQHALHHAHVLNQVYEMPIAGGIGWCAFDYNTHAQFGSGDRICYHGVMDIFRQPKLIAALYAAQLEPSTRIVLEPITYWTRGDQDEGRISPLWIFSNLERVEVIVDGTNLGAARRSERFAHLPQAPFVFDHIPGGWGEHFGELEVIGFLAGQVVASKKIAADGVSTRLEAKLDHAQILADGSDMTRLSLKATDDYGNIQPFAMHAVQLELSGPGELIGPNPAVLIGGRVAVFIKSTRTPGTIRIQARTDRLQTKTLVLENLPVMAASIRG